MPFVEQMANIGSEVERALNWRAKQEPEYSQKALERAFELMDLTLENVKGFPRLKEVARLREVVADHFYGENAFGSTEKGFRKYFFAFALAARKDR